MNEMINQLREENASLKEEIDLLQRERLCLLRLARRYFPMSAIKKELDVLRIKIKESNG